MGPTHFSHISEEDFMFQNLLAMLLNDEGATLIEYALVGIASVAVLKSFQKSISANLAAASSQMQ